MCFYIFQSSNIVSVSFDISMDITCRPVYHWSSFTGKGGKEIINSADDGSSRKNLDLWPPIFKQSMNFMASLAVCPSLTSVPLVRRWGHVAPDSQGYPPVKQTFYGKSSLPSRLLGHHVLQAGSASAFHCRHHHHHHELGYRSFLNFVIIYHHLFSHPHFVVIWSVSIVRHTVFEFVS